MRDKSIIIFLNVQSFSQQLLQKSMSQFPLLLQQQVKKAYPHNYFSGGDYYATNDLFCVNHIIFRGLL